MKETTKDFLAIATLSATAFVFGFIVGYLLVLLPIKDIVITFTTTGFFVILVWATYRAGIEDL